MDRQSLPRVLQDAVVFARPITLPNSRLLQKTTLADVTAGVGLFGTFTAYVASFFLQQSQKKEEDQIALLLVELRAIKERLDRLEDNTKHLD